MVLFDGVLAIHNRLFEIRLHEDEWVAPDNCFNNQKNGLAGAAHPDHIEFDVPSGIHALSVKVELLDSAPPIDENFEEIVEVSCKKGEKRWFLAEFGWEDNYPLDLPEGELRMRLSVLGYDLEHDESVFDLDEAAMDEILEAPILGQKYLIQFWQAEFEQDVIVKQTSIHAEQLHQSKSAKGERPKRMRDDGYVRPWWRFW